MYVFAEPVTEERADQIQNIGTRYAKKWARRVLGVGKNDPEAEEEWQDLQEEVDEQVSEDGTAKEDVESTAVHEEAETSAESEAATEGGERTIESETTAENVDVDHKEAILSPPKFEKDTASGGPLMGWTVTIRNKVNGHFMPRPEQLESEDNWEIEYNVQDIEEESVWQLYNAIKERRRQLVGLSDDETNQGLENYRKVIQRYASRGRKWRARQDKLDKKRGVRLYKPLGPGTPEYAEMSESEPASASTSESTSDGSPEEPVTQSKE